MPSPPPESPQPRRPARRGARPKRSTAASALVGMLAGLVGLNVCITLAMIGYYLDARSRAVALDETPPSPIEVLQTAVPDLTGLDPTPASTPTPTPPTGIVNILLLGKDERPDEVGLPTRTDTLMVLRVDFDRRSAKLLSLPRDMWVALPNLQRYGITEGRINTAYYYGQLFGLAGGGAKQARETVTLNFGIPIDHHAVVNFQGFVQMVDALGGIEVDVPERIYDRSFPTDDYGTMTLVIEAGLQHMDGTTALRYARTRHQDSDTSRIKRQQLVLLAIREKALRVDAVSRLPEMYAAAQGTFETDLSLPELIAYGLVGQGIDRSQITTYAIDQSYLVPWTTPAGANVWIPRRAIIAPVVEAFLATP